MIFKLLSEAYLVERFTFDELWDRYKNKLNIYSIGRDSLEWYLKRYDPTADTQSPGTAGEYAEFITRILINEGPKAMDTTYKIQLPSQYEGLINISDTLSFKRLLSEFDKNKMFFKIRDINRYQSTQELVDAFSTIEISKKQIQKLRRSTMLDNKVVFVGKNYTVFNPQTWEAMSSFATLSGWCDADTRPEFGPQFFNRYAPVYVLVPNSQLNGTTPVPINKRKNWIQIAPVNNESYGYGYYNGEQDKEKVAQTLLALTSDEWLEANADVVKAVKTEVDNNFPFLPVEIEGLNEGATIQTITFPAIDFFGDLATKYLRSKMLSIVYNVIYAARNKFHGVSDYAVSSIVNTRPLMNFLRTVDDPWQRISIEDEYRRQLFQAMYPLLMKSLNTNFMRFDGKSVTLKFPTEELLAMAPSPKRGRSQRVTMQDLMLKCFANKQYELPAVPKSLEPETWVKNYIKNNFD